MAKEALLHDGCTLKQAVLEAATICPRPLQVDLWSFDPESVVESRVTWPTPVPISVFLGLCSRLKPDVRDRKTSDTHHRLMPPTLGAGA